jgi:hypothetical protein
LDFNYIVAYGRICNIMQYYERQEEKQVAEEQKAYEKSVNGHKNIQSKETLKMMQETERQSKQLNKSRKR